MDGTTVESITEDILDTELKVSIPKDTANTDYQEYLDWKAIDGNEPDPAD